MRNHLTRFLTLSTRLETLAFVSSILALRSSSFFCSSADFSSWAFFSSSSPESFAADSAAASAAGRLYQKTKGAAVRRALRFHSPSGESHLGELLEERVVLLEALFGLLEHRHRLLLADLLDQLLEMRRRAPARREGRVATAKPSNGPRGSRTPAATLLRKARSAQVIRNSR